MLCTLLIFSALIHADIASSDCCDSRFRLFIFIIHTGSGVSSWLRCESLSREGCKTLKGTCIDEASKGKVDSPTPPVIFLFFSFFYSHILSIQFVYICNYTGNGVSSWQRCESLSREGCKTLRGTCIDETSKGNLDSPTPSVIFLFIIIIIFFFFWFFFCFCKLNRICLISETLLVVSRVIWMLLII
jgi:hypothetical protein